MLRHRCLARRYPPNGIRHVIGHIQRAALSIEKYADRATPCVTILEKASSQIDRFAIWPSAPKRYEHDFVPGRIAAVPTTVLTHERAFREWTAKSTAGCETQAKRGHV